MQRVLAASAALLAASVAFAAPAQADPQTRYFECGGQTPFTNLTEPPPTWSAAAPTRALAEGGGCVGLADGALDATFGGTHAGAVAELELTLHSRASSPQFLPDIMTIEVTVDGQSVFTGEELEGTAVPAGSGPRDFRTTWTIEGLDVPASTTPKQFVITVTDPYINDFVVYGRGARDMPSGVTLLSPEDLAPAGDAGT